MGSRAITGMIMLVVGGTEGPMAYSERLAERVRRRLAGLGGVEEKRMFGGVAFLLSGNLCVGVRKDSLLVRLGPGRDEEALRRPDVSRFAVAGRPMNCWVLVAPEGVEDDGQLDEWIRRAGTFVGTLPAK
jgi:TfoX/Sxy family transcriptional regulator of competence genes